MNTTRKIIFIPILFILFLTIFTFLDFGMEINNLTQLVQPIFFALTAIISIFFKGLRRIILIISLTLLLLMILAYLLNLMDISDWLGSLGFGIFIVTIAAYLPEFIKKGFIEKY